MTINLRREKEDRVVEQVLNIKVDGNSAARISRVRIR